ncbi:MAG: hypothetical protein ACKV0T_01120 [Planctomycetales bacterium]
MSQQRPQRFGNLVRWWHIVLFVLLVTVLLAPFVIRSARLAGIPDIPDPFDVAAFGFVPLDPEDNAFTLYTQLCAGLRPMSHEAGEQFDGAVTEGWSAAGPELREWLQQNRGLLTGFRAASERLDALYHQPAELTISTPLPTVQGLRELSRLAILEGTRLEHEGNYPAAWNCYRMVFRCSRHLGHHGTIIERLVGVALHAVATNAMLRWSEAPAVDAAQLRTALQDVRTSYKKTPSISMAFKTEYLVNMKTLRNPDRFQELGGDATQNLLRIRPLAYVLGEPEISRRVLKHFWTNVLSGCDMSRDQRPLIVLGAAVVDRPVELPDDTTASPQEISSWLQRTILARLLVPAVKQVVESTDREAARQLLLELALSIQRFRRERGEWPHSLSDLHADFPESLPIDPYGTGTPLGFRAEEDPSEGTTIWSIFTDGVDDEGRVDGRKPEAAGRGDLIVKVRERNAPREQESESSP